MSFSVDKDTTMITEHFNSMEAYIRHRQRFALGIVDGWEPVHVSMTKEGCGQFAGAATYRSVLTLNPETPE